jgi:hypothetical protein
MRRFRIWFLSSVVLVWSRWKITVSGERRAGMFDEEIYGVFG